MKKITLYSSSGRARRAGDAAGSAAWFRRSRPRACPAQRPPSGRSRARGWLGRHERALLVAAGAAVALAAVGGYATLAPGPSG
jgi:hypothetical protein